MSIHVGRGPVAKLINSCQKNLACHLDAPVRDNSEELGLVSEEALPYRDFSGEIRYPTAKWRVKLNIVGEYAQELLVACDSVENFCEHSSPRVLGQGIHEILLSNCFHKYTLSALKERVCFLAEVYYFSIRTSIVMT